MSATFNAASPSSTWSNTSMDEDELMFSPRNATKDEQMAIIKQHQENPLANSAPHKCPLRHFYADCMEKTYSGKRTLDEHVDGHRQQITGNWNHYCSKLGCSRSKGGKGFAQRNNCKKHERSHLSQAERLVRQEICKACGKGFDHKYTLKRHIQKGSCKADRLSKPRKKRTSSPAAAAVTAIPAAAMAVVLPPEDVQPASIEPGLSEFVQPMIDFAQIGAAAAAEAAAASVTPAPCSYELDPPFYSYVRGYPETSESPVTLGNGLVSDFGSLDLGLDLGNDLGLGLFLL